MSAIESTSCVCQCTAASQADDIFSSKQIPEFPDYFITRSGRVFRKTFKNGNCKRTYNPPREIARPLKNGYPTVNLSRNGKLQTLWLHQVVLKTFVGPRHPGLIARHKNGVRSDCRIENLEWSTRRTNYDDMVLHGTVTAGTRNGNAKLRDSQVSEMRSLKSAGWTTASLVSKYGISRTSVQKICARKMWRHIQ